MIPKTPLEPPIEAQQSPSPPLVPAELASQRAEFEAQIAGLRSTIHREFGWAPRTARWVAPAVAAAVGWTLARWLRAASGKPDARPRRPLRRPR